MTTIAEDRLSKKYTKKDLVKAQRILQFAHNYTENAGFNICVSTVSTPTDDERKAAKKNDVEGVNVGECCFIGGARLAAGTNPKEYWKATDYGDGPELTIALELLDRAVIENSSKDKIVKLERVDFREGEPGGIAEASAENSNFTTYKALKVYRHALTYCYNEIEKKTRKKK